MPATTQEITRQEDAYRRATSAVRAAVLDYLGRSWLGLGSWRDTDVDRWVASVVPILSAGQMQTATLTDAHLANVIAGLADDRPRPLGIRPDDVSTQALRGVSAAEVYRRAGETVWSELSRGTDLADAVARGLDRANRMAATDLQLAKTHTARKVLSSDRRVVGYRRVTDANPCKLCAVASTQRYRTGDLMPLHARCSCTVMPLLGNRDPGQVIDKERLRQIKAGETKVAVHDHGEVGPVLTDAEHSFASV